MSHLISREEENILELINYGDDYLQTISSSTSIKESGKKFDEYQKKIKETADTLTMNYNLINSFGKGNIIIYVYGNLFQDFFNNEIIPFETMIRKINEFTFGVLQDIWCGRGIDDNQIKYLSPFCRMIIKIFVDKKFQINLQVNEKCFNHQISNLKSCH